MKDSPARYAQKLKANALWRKRHPEKHKASNRKAALKRRYGLTPEALEALVVGQKGRCRVCRVKFGTDKKSKPHVDHCHKTGNVRGILCMKCNTALGHLNDSTEVVERLLRYLRKNS